MRERVFRFGAQGNLIGVLTEPDDGARPASPALLVSNVGLNHRIGPNRLWVDLARLLAERGLATLRFDGSGLGDSDPRRGASDGEIHGVADLEDAMRFLESKRGVRRFAIAGLCSGVDSAHVVALADGRVAGAAFIDGYAYATLGYEVRAAAQRVRGILRPVRWRRWFTRRVLGRTEAPLPGYASTYSGEGAAIFKRVYPPIEHFRADVQQMVARGMQLFYLYTADAAWFDRRTQFEAMMGWKELPADLEVEHWPETDHVFTAAGDRARAVHRLAAWMETCCSQSRAPAPVVAERIS